MIRKNQKFALFARRYWHLFAPIYAWRGIGHGILFIVYIRFVHPLLLSLLVNARASGQTHIGLGVLLLLIQAGEVLGIRLKWDVVQARIQKYPNPSIGAKFSVGAAQLAHVFLCLLVLVSTFSFFGQKGICFNFDTRFLPCFLTNIAFYIILAKEGAVFYLMLHDKKQPKLVDLDDPVVKMREMLGELPLLVFGMTTFTLSWNAIMTTLAPVQAGEFWISLISSVFLFLMLYPPSRLVFFAEEWLIKQKLFNRLLIVFFLLLALVTAILEVPGIIK